MLVRPSDVCIALLVIHVMVVVAIFAFDAWLLGTARPSITQQIDDMPRLQWALVLALVPPPLLLAGHFWLP